MPRATWPLQRGRPRIEIFLTQSLDRQQTGRILLADTGAGSERAPFELIVDETDCLTCGGKPTGTVTLRGVFSGAFPVYDLRVGIPQIGFDHFVRVVGVPNPLAGFDGIAGYRFLDRFGYGNFGRPREFGLEL